MRFTLDVLTGAVNQQLTVDRTLNDPTWIGPDIDNNIIENIPSSANFDP